jgi:heme-degrading monooxygenase HmoA
VVGEIGSEVDGMIVLIVRFRSALEDEDVVRTISERLPDYETLPGLLQKYYVHDPATGEYGGIYVWEDEASLREFRSSDLARSIRDAYRSEGELRIETLDVVSVLRVGAGARIPS